MRSDVALLFGAPAVLGLVLALTLVGLVSLVSWRWRQQRRIASPDTSEGVQQGENCIWGSARAAVGSGWGWGRNPLVIKRGQNGDTGPRESWS